MRIGYAHVSIRGPSLDIQVDALREAGCEKIYREAVIGACAERPVLDELLCNIRVGDVLVIWKLDCLGRSLRRLLDLVGILMYRGVGLQSLHDPVDTTTPHGRLTVTIFASLAEIECDLIRERIQAGLRAARAHGRIGGRPKGITQQAEATAMAAETLYREGKLSTRQIADRLHISKRTLYVYLRHRGVAIGAHRRQNDAG